MPTTNDYSTGRLPTWCPGCGDFGIWASIKNALVELNLAPQDVVFVYGIGCHGNMYDSLKTTAFEGLHGRPLPVACAIKMANHKLPVFAVSGDGDALGEGGNHFIHACRRNYDITYIIHDNQVYGLTKGQTSPTSPKGFKTRSNPDGTIDYPLNPVAMAIAAGATFVARGFAGDIPKLTTLIKQAYKHKGFAVLDILQPCVTFNHTNTYIYYRQNAYYLDQSYLANDRVKAYEKALEWDKTGKIPLGIFFQEQKDTYEEDIVQIKDVALVDQPLNSDISSLLQEFV